MSTEKFNTESKMKRMGEYLRERRLKKNLSYRELATYVGLSHTTIKNIEEGKTKPTLDMLYRLCRGLLIDLEDLLRESGYLSNIIPVKREGRAVRKVPVISWVMAGKWREVCDSFQPGDADEWIETDVKGQNVFALKVRGDSMEPEFHDGEIIIVNPHVEAQPGDFVVVKNEDNGEATFKQLKKYGDTWVLHPLNPKYPDIMLKKNFRYRIVGKVVKKEKRY